MAGLEGKILSDRYELRRVVGRGGMADVYEGFDPRFQRSVAIKVFKREDEDMLRRFIREAHLMARLSNPHLVSIYDSGASPIDGVTWYYIVVPFMQGGTLRARIRRSSLSLQEACRSVGEIAAALDYIHSQGIIHRDIKSSNVLLDAEGHCYLSDFGIARMTTDATQMTTTGNVLGTVDYIAPELFEINRRADARSDLYSLGVLLFEMVTGQLPFSAENQIALVSMHMNKRPPSPRSISQQISPQVERVILKGLEKKPEQRYSSATEFADAFCRAVNKKEERNDAGKRGRSEYPEPVVQTNLFSQAPVPALPPLPLAQERQKLQFPPVAGSTQTPSFVPPTQYVPPQSPHPSELRKPARGSRVSRGRAWITIGSMLAVLIVIGLLLFAALHQSAGNTLVGTPTAQPSTTTGTQTSDVTPTATPNETATAQAIAAATATAQAEATATAQAQATATVVAQATATAGVIQTATAGTPSYDDKLNDANKPETKAANWDKPSVFDSHCAFAQDSYHVTQNSTGNLHACHESANSYGDATISVDVTMLSGNSSGLFYHFSLGPLNSYHGYFFEVDSKGRYKISVFGNSVLQPWTASSALKQGYSVTNTLQVIMQGHTFSFYANGVFLKTLTDDNNTYSSGNLALAAVDVDTSTEVVYSNLKVYPSS